MATRLGMIRKYFGDARAVTTDELKKLTKEDRHELADLISAETGEAIEEMKQIKQKEQGSRNAPLFFYLVSLLIQQAPITG